MGAFTPFKRHANKFNYTPRFYDPAKEARDQRRAELTGQSRAEDGVDYQPGDYIRRQGVARAARRGANKGSNPFKMWIYVGAIFAVLILGSMLYGRLLEMFVPGGGQLSESSTVSASEEEEFDPYAPIIIVPNDYEEPTQSE